MEITVERVSKTGLGIAAGGKWYNRGKNCNLSTFNGLDGKRVSLDLQDDKWINKVTLLENGTNGTPGSNRVAESKTSATLTAIVSPDTQLQYNRAEAVKAVFQSPSLALVVQNMDLAAAVYELKSFVPEVAHYIETGLFASSQTEIK